MIEHAVTVGKVYRAGEMLDDPHYAAREALVELASARWGKIAMPNVTPKLSSSPGSVRWPEPETLGEHNEEVYSSLLKLDREALDALRRNGTI